MGPLRGIRPMPTAVQCVRWRCLRLYEDRDESPPLCHLPAPASHCHGPAGVSRCQPGPRAPGGGSGPVPLRRRPGPAIPLTRFGQGTGTGLPPHPDSVPAPAVSRPAPWPVSRPELTSVHHQPGCLLFPPGTGGRCLATAPWRRPGPAVLVLCVYEERARLAPTTFVGFFWRILRRLVPAAGEGPFPQVDEEQPGR